MHLECGQCPIILIILLTAALNDNVGVRCFGDIPPNNWTLLACDGKDTYCNNPAVVLTDINIPLILPSSIGKAMFVDDHYKFNVFYLASIITFTTTVIAPSVVPSATDMMNDDVDTTDIIHKAQCLHHATGNTIINYFYSINVNN